MKQYAPIFLLIPFLFGCAGFQLAERQNNATTDVSEQWSRNQKEMLKVAIGAAAQSGKEATVEFSADNSEAGNGDQSLAAESDITIPGGVKMILAAVGLGLLVFVFGIIRRSSASVRAVTNAADRGIANAINRIEAKLYAATSAEEKAAHAATLSELEKARGQAARRI